MLLPFEDLRAKPRLKAQHSAKWPRLAIPGPICRKPPVRSKESIDPRVENVGECFLLNMTSKER